MAEKAKAQSSGNTRTLILLAAGVIVCAIFFLIPTPNGFTPEGWKVLGLLVPVVIIWITDAMPIGVAATVFLAFVVCFKLAPANVAFAGFTDHITWLLFGAFALGSAMNQSGLSKRLTNILIRLARGYWGVIASVYIANLFLIGVPSTAARSSILSPLLNAVVDVAGRPMKSNFTRFMAYNFCMATNAFLGMLVLTGSSANAVMISLYTQATGIEISFLTWILIMILPALIIAAGLFITGLILCGRPEKEYTDMLKAAGGAGGNTESLGKTTADEWKVIIAFVVAIVLWISGDMTGLRPGFVALIIAGILFVPVVGVFKNARTSLGGLNWAVILLIGSVAGLGGIMGANATGLSLSISDLVFAPVLDPLYGSLGYFGLAIAMVILSTILHIILPSPTNVTLMIPLMVTWALGVNMEAAGILAFVGFLNVMLDRMVFSAYQMPPYFVFLGLDVTDIPRFNTMLIVQYIPAVVLCVVGAFVAYGLIVLTGLGLA